MVVMVKEPIAHSLTPRSLLVLALSLLQKTVIGAVLNLDPQGKAKLKGTDSWPYQIHTAHQIGCQ